MSTDLETAAAVIPGFVEKAPLERFVAPDRPSLVGKSRAELATALGELGVPQIQRKMRVQQLWHWLYVRGATSFDVMTSVSKELRADLEKRLTLARPDVVAEQVSVDGTRKWLVRLPAENPKERPHEVECVYIPESGRGTQEIEPSSVFSGDFSPRGGAPRGRDHHPKLAVGQGTTYITSVRLFVAATDVA